jgi:hypothetical protein
MSLAYINTLMNSNKPEMTAVARKKELEDKQFSNLLQYGLMAYNVGGGLWDRFGDARNAPGREFDTHGNPLYTQRKEESLLGRLLPGNTWDKTASLEDSGVTERANKMFDVEQLTNEYVNRETFMNDWFKDLYGEKTLNWFGAENE